MRLAGCATEQVMLAARHCNAAQMAQVNAANSKLNKLRAHRLDLEAVLRDAGFQEGDEAASPPRRCSSLPRRRASGARGAAPPSGLRRLPGAADQGD